MFPAQKNELRAAKLKTPLGQMVAIADSRSVYLLQFADCPELPKLITWLEKRTGLAVVPGRTPAIDSLEKELVLYFAGKRATFSTPVALLGTPFQLRVWKALQEIPSQDTRSYAEIAKKVGHPTAYRAVGGAIGDNRILIIVPCHRVIESSGGLGGYGGGKERKRWLLNHEAG
jgi:AraC family transcriptional regulator of adaptative response/methylated-DNA-[protein]-cysteine methyltransferase